MTTATTHRSLDPARPEAPVAARIRLVELHERDAILTGEGAELHGPPVAPGSNLEAPVWAELYLELEPAADANIGRRVYEWFEGSIVPWDDLARPRVAWDEDAAATLSAIGLTAPGPDLADPPDETRALTLLPHLYALGFNRIRQELDRKGVKAGPTPEAAHANRASGNGGSPSANGDSAGAPRLDLFPMIGFERLAGERAELTGRVLRTNVAVLGERIVTIRLPDLWCPPVAGMARINATSEPLYAPERFFPCWDACAADVAEELARHQASTARAVADEVRESLDQCVKSPDGEPSRKPLRLEERHALEEQKDAHFTRLALIAEMAERQLARLLRRLGSYGRDEESDGTLAADMRRRYHYALDEVRQLSNELTSARDRHRAHMDAQAQIASTRFQDNVAVVGSAILVPTLIVGVFGANVWLPGKEDLHGFFALLMLVVGSAAAAVLAIDVIRHRPLLTWALRSFLIAAVLACAAGTFAVLRSDADVQRAEHPDVGAVKFIAEQAPPPARP